MGKEKQSGLRVKAIIDSEYATFVKTFDFFPRADCECKSEGYHQLVNDDVLPAEVDDVLSNLGKLPNLETLNMKFSVYWYWTDEYDKDPDSPPRETSDQVREAERTECWRAFMAKSFDNLAKNATVTIKKLVIHDFVMKEVSSFTTLAWYHFLSQLDRFEMTIPGSDNRDVREIVH